MERWSTPSSPLPQEPPCALVKILEMTSQCHVNCKGEALHEWPRTVAPSWSDVLSGQVPMPSLSQCMHYRQQFATAGQLYNGIDLRQSCAGSPSSCGSVRASLDQGLYLATKQLTNSNKPWWWEYVKHPAPPLSFIRMCFEPSRLGQQKVCDSNRRDCSSCLAMPMIAW